jgi:hypothetical protein
MIESKFGLEHIEKDIFDKKWTILCSDKEYIKCTNIH